MRIISQSGMIDLPYEQVGIFINVKDSKEIISCPIGSSNYEYDYWMMAKYSTPEKAKKAMEMLRGKYAEKVTAYSDEYYFAYIPPKVFRFPQDEEIEVLSEG